MGFGDMPCCQRSRLEAGPDSCCAITSESVASSVKYRGLPPGDYVKRWLMCCMCRPSALCSWRLERTRQPLWPRRWKGLSQSRWLPHFCSSTPAHSSSWMPPRLQVCSTWRLLASHRLLSDLHMPVTALHRRPASCAMSCHSRPSLCTDQASLDCDCIGQFGAGAALQAMKTHVCILPLHA